MICTQEDIDYNNTITTVTTTTGTKYTYKVDWAPGPYTIPSTLEPISKTYNGYSSTFVGEGSPCKYCRNNPANNKFASGVCHCILGQQQIY